MAGTILVLQAADKKEGKGKEAEEKEELLKEKLSVAKGSMQRGDTKGKAEAIKKALDIIVRLQAALDFEKGGQIATRLDDLYTFCTNRLALANAINDSTMIDEVYRVIAEIKAGWSQIEGITKDV